MPSRKRPAVANPYLDVFTEFVGGPKNVYKDLMELDLERWIQAGRPDELGRSPLMKRIHLRKELVAKYAWAIPNEEALRTIAKHSPLLEIGGGSGYWAHLLEQMGADIVTYDSGGLPYTQYWKQPEKGDASTVERHPNRTLFLCWPPYQNSMGYDALCLYRGEILLYVGEEREGCTGDQKFHAYLEEHFELVKTVQIPQWAGIHDALFVMKRLHS
jgi:hypothetical protein